MKRRTTVQKAASVAASSASTPISKGPVTPGKLVRLLHALKLTRKGFDEIEGRQLDQVVVNGGLAYITNGHWAVRAQVGDLEACDWVKAFQMETLVDSITGDADITQGLPARDGYPEQFPKVETSLMARLSIESPDRKTCTISAEYLLAAGQFAHTLGWKSVDIGVINDTNTLTFRRYEFDEDKKQEVDDLFVVMPIRK